MREQITVGGATKKMFTKKVSRQNFPKRTTALSPKNISIRSRLINIVVKVTHILNLQYTVRSTHISTLSTLTPQGSVASSSVCSMTCEMVSRSERISARCLVPRTLRRVVAARRWVEWLRWKKGWFSLVWIPIRMSKICLKYFCSDGVLCMWNMRLCDRD